MKGFSLVELMVVIAIVALLAAVSVPTYKSYIVRSKIASAIPVFDSIKVKSLNYYMINGTWPTAAQLGYTTTGGNIVLSNPETDLAPIISPLASGGSYIDQISITTPCSTTYQEVRLVIEAGSDGPFLNGAVLGYFRFGENNEGIIIQQCSDDDDSSGEENVYLNNCTYASKSAFETALCS